MPRVADDPSGFLICIFMYTFAKGPGVVPVCARTGTGIRYAMNARGRMNQRTCFMMPMNHASRAQHSSTPAILNLTSSRIKANAMISAIANGTAPQWDRARTYNNSTRNFRFGSLSRASYAFLPRVEKYLQTAGLARKVVGYRKCQTIFVRGSACQLVLYLQRGRVKLFRVAQVH
jgi:hypothetical protein